MFDRMDSQASWCSSWFMNTQNYASFNAVTFSLVLQLRSIFQRAKKKEKRQAKSHNQWNIIVFLVHRMDPIGSTLFCIYKLWRKIWHRLNVIESKIVNRGSFIFMANVFSDVKRCSVLCANIFKKWWNNVQRTFVFDLCFVLQRKFD